MSAGNLKNWVLVAGTVGFLLTFFCDGLAITQTDTFLTVLDRKKPAVPPRTPHAPNPKFDKVYGKGVTLSHHNNEPDWDELEADFVILKASEGSNFVDKKFCSRLAKCKQRKIPVGAYHFFTGRDNPLTEIENFYKTIGFHIDIIPVLEIDIMPKVKKLTKKDFQGKLRTLFNAFKDKYERLPIIYTNERFYNSHIKDVISNNFADDDIILWFNDVRTNYADFMDTPHLHQTKCTSEGVKGKINITELHCPLEEIFMK